MKKFAKWALAAVALAAVPAGAHHSYSMFDMAKTIELKATVTQFKWQNPHSFILADVDAPGGKESWAIEMTAPANLVQEGWTRTSLKAGDKVTIWVHPLRSGLIRSVILSPGLSAARVQPWRLRLFGLLSSIDQCRPPVASSSMKACGLVHWNSVTVPSSVMILVWSNIAKL